MASIAVTDHQAVRTIRLQRPEKKNALTFAMYRAMAEALREAGADPAIRAVVFAGAPGAFSAGNDLRDFVEGFRATPPHELPTVAFLHALADCPKPLLAAVDGLAVGIGTTLLLHCDYVVASRRSRFSTPFSALGLVPEAGSSLLGPRQMGYKRAFALLVMGRPLTAEQALEAGLVSALAEAETVEAEAQRTAEEIAALPPEAVAIGRRLLRGSVEDLHRRIDEEIGAFAERAASPEAQAAFAAFLGRKS